MYIETVTAHNSTPVALFSPKFQMGTDGNLLKGQEIASKLDSSYWEQASNSSIFNPFCALGEAFLAFNAADAANVRTKVFPSSCQPLLNKATNVEL